MGKEKEKLLDINLNKPIDKKLVKDFKKQRKNHKLIKVKINSMYTIQEGNFIISFD